MGESSGEHARLATATGEGASLGEAKWSAVKALEREFPGISADDVEFQVIDEGDQDAARPTPVEAEVDAASAANPATLPDEPAVRDRAVVPGRPGAIELR